MRSSTKLDETTTGTRIRIYDPEDPFAQVIDHQLRSVAGPAEEILGTGSFTDGRSGAAIHCKNNIEDALIGAYDKKYHTPYYRRLLIDDLVRSGWTVPEISRFLDQSQMHIKSTIHRIEKDMKVRRRQGVIA